MLGLGLLPSAAITAAAVAITVWATVATSASGAGAALQGLGHGIVVGVPIAVALYVCRLPAHTRFGRVLLIVSGLWFLASLSTSSSSLLYSVGQFSSWLAEVGLVYLVLVFPGGRPRDRVDRTLWTVVVGGTVLLFLPTALLIHEYRAPAPGPNCHHGCPHNVFMIIDRQPAFINSFVVPLRELIATTVFIIVSVRLARRIRGANSLMRRTLRPVLVVAIAWLISLVLFNVARRTTGADSALTQAMAWLGTFAAPGFALAFLLGLVRWHLFVTAGIRKVNARLLQTPGPQEVQELLAEAFDDPRLRIASWFGRRHRWIDARGVPVEKPDADSGRYLSEVRDERRRVVAILHDAALAGDPAFVEAAGAAASVAFASDRVAGRTAGLIRELKASRARTLAAADDERRRIERDLHDGAQQQLVALSIHLELAAEKAEGEHPAEASGLRELADEVEQALEQMRILTRGIHPATLAERGLEAIVRSAARRSPVPTTVEVRDVRDYPPEIVTAVYFCCVEALQNVAKHAREAHAANIVLRDANSVLSFSISDDGPGMIVRDARIGAALLNMRDRITTVGGRLTVQSHPGQGTRVSGRVPVAAAPRSTERHRDERTSLTTAIGRRREHTET